MGAFLNRAGGRPTPNQIDVGIKVVDSHPCVLSTEEWQQYIYVATDKAWYWNTETHAIELRDEE